MVQLKPEPSGWYMIVAPSSIKSMPNYIGSTIKVINDTKMLPTHAGMEIFENSLLTGPGQPLRDTHLSNNLHLVIDVLLEIYHGRTPTAKQFSETKPLSQLFVNIGAVSMIMAMKGDRGTKFGDMSTMPAMSEVDIDYQKAFTMSGYGSCVSELSKQPTSSSGLGTTPSPTAGFGQLGGSTSQGNLAGTTPTMPQSTPMNYNSLDFGEICKLIAEEGDNASSSAFYNLIVYQGFNKTRTAQLAISTFGAVGCFQLALLGAERGTNTERLKKVVIDVKGKPQTIEAITGAGLLLSTARGLGPAAMSLGRLAATFCSEVAGFYFKNGSKTNQFPESMLPGWCAFPSAIGLALGGDFDRRIGIYSDCFSVATNGQFKAEIIAQAQRTAVKPDGTWFEDMVTSFNTYAAAHPIPAVYHIRKTSPGGPITL